ncbi:GNAT family N-acetyltransferase [Microbacterium sp. HJ5]
MLASVPLRFVEADVSSRGELQSLLCTSERATYDPGLRRKVHSAPWALEAQSLLRNLQPPLGSGESLILAYDEVGLAAACHYEYLAPSDEVEGVFNIAEIGCDVRCQGQGVASELLAHVLDLIQESNFSHGTSWGVITLIHEENQPSKQLAARHGFSWRSYEGHGYELWGRP